jgi:hypothetical protein
MANNDWIRVIHVARKETGIDEDAYRAILSGAGVSSSKDISNLEQFNTVMSAFKNLGFRYAPGSGSSPGNVRKATVDGNEGFISARQEYYIRGLWQLASRVKTEKGLRSLIKRIGKVDDIHFLPVRNAAAVIQALRKICWAAGLNPDRKEAP